MEYRVEDSDTLERIAARFDCTVGQLMKLNKMNSRMVFAGQTLIVPSPVSDEVFEESKAQNGLYPTPGTAVQIIPQQPSSTRSSTSTAKTKEPSVTSQDKEKSKLSNTDSDVDCLQRFLKVKVKHVTENDGTVTGTLLVTPNALMFDPDVSHPLVKENGQDLYIMMAHMEDIMSVAVFKDIGALTGDKNRSDIYDPDHVSKTADDVSEVGSTGKETETASAENRSQGALSPAIEVEDSPFLNEIQHSCGDQRLYGRLKCLGGSDSQLPLIAEEENRYGADLHVPVMNRRTVSDVGSQCTDYKGKKENPEVPLSSSTESYKSQQSSNHSVNVPSTSRVTGKISPLSSRNSLSKLGRTLSAHASSIRDSAEKVTQSAVTGTKSMAHGVVTHTRSAAETLQTGIQSGAKKAASHAKVAVDAMVSVPQGIVLMGTGLFAEGQQAIAEAMDTSKDSRAVANIRRQQSLATLETLKQRTLQAREQAYKEREAAFFTCATSPDDKPDLFRPVQELLEQARRLSEVSGPLLTTELPYYMAVRLNKKKLRARTSRTVSSSIGSSSNNDFDGEYVGNRTRREFWFAIPREKVDGIYHFLLQWNPEKYGEEAFFAAGEEVPAEEPYPAPVSGYQFTDNSFIVLDSEVDEKLAG